MFIVDLNIIKLIYIISSQVHRYVHCIPETLLNRYTTFHHMSNLFGGLLTRLDRLASTRCVSLIATGYSGCGIAPGCAAARSSSRSSLISSFEDGSFLLLVYHSFADDCVCTRLLAVRMLYDLGVLALFVTLANMT